MTFRRSVRGGPPGPGGYRRLIAGPDEPHLDRTDLAPAPEGRGDPLLTVAHLSDLHVCDAQSPARAEFLDRWADPDSPIRDRVGEVGTYRPHEMLTAQVVAAMTQAVNALDRAPGAGAPIDLAIVTGDNTDNAQANELAWYLALLDGGTVRPDSGDVKRYEGVADDDVPDERFWHPGTAFTDLPRERFGFPTVPGLLDAARAAFETDGLTVPWLAVHGNHDRLVQGTVPGLGALAVAAVGGTKAIGLPAHWSDDAIVALLAGLNDCEPAAIEALAAARYRAVTPDPARRIITRAEFVEAHLRAGARPAGHGFGTDGRPYYRYDAGRVSILVLDTVDEHGGWEGSLDPDQLGWLAAELAAADAERRYVVLASHHPTTSLINDRSAPDAPRRVLATELGELLAAHPSLVLWLNGHTHRTAVRPHGSWWEVTAPSLIDWPQQARIVELLRGVGTLTIALTMLDHTGPTPWDGSLDGPLALAGLSRELAANDWQWRGTDLEDHPRAGTRADRNVLLHLADPWV